MILLLHLWPKIENKINIRDYISPSFLKDLYDELIPIAWHPSRVLEWCLDFEESKGFESALGWMVYLPIDLLEV